MFHYILALLLVNTYSGSLGVPLPQNATNGPLAKLLEDLANRCENTFLTAQIKAKLDECNVLAPPYNKKQFQCLIFYDINSQLCEAAVASKLPLVQDAMEKEYTSTVSEPINIEKLCTSARAWNFTTMANYPKFRDTAAKVFSLRASCVRICGVEELTSEDSNFFCKYFKWGSEMLSGPSIEAKSDVSAEPIGETVVNSNIDSSIPAAIRDNNNIPAANPNVVTNEIHPTKTIEPNKEETSPEDQLQLALPQNQSVVEGSLVPKEPLDVKVELKSTEKPINLAPVNAVLNNDNEALDKPFAADIEPPKKEEENKVEVGLNIQPGGQRDPANDKPKQEPDDYQDSEEGLPDGGEDGDDPVINVVDTKQYSTQTKSTQKLETPMSFVGERKFYPNSMQEEFPENDDHFFSFFLTAVILVIVLYVLYHNKSKVSKVFLGLIVEGRQPGRRRNSRGHAYRRLDTLEQAMNTNSAAPPSKIIY